MKHGPIALVDRQTPCLFVAPRGSLHAKTLSNIEEVRARDGLVISVGTEGDQAVAALSERLMLALPDVPFLCDYRRGVQIAPRRGSREGCGSDWALTEWPAMLKWYLRTRSAIAS